MVLHDPSASPEQSWCAETHRRSYPVDKIFLLLASLTAVPDVMVMRGNVVISHEAATISVGDGRYKSWKELVISLQTRRNQPGELSDR